jgi:hypothetical protein
MVLSVSPGSSRISSRRRQPLVIVLPLAAAFLLALRSLSSSNLSDTEVLLSNHTPFDAVRGVNDPSLLRAAMQQARAEDNMRPNVQELRERPNVADENMWQDPLIGSGSGESSSGGYGRVEGKEEEDKDPFGYSKIGREKLFDEQDRAPTGLQLSELEEKEMALSEPVRICKECKCDVPGSYAASKAFFLPVPTTDKLRSVITKTRSFHEPALLRYLSHTILLQSTLEGTFLNENAISELLTNHHTCPDALIAFNFEGLQLDRPTSYIYTRTGPGGKLADWTDRGKYMARQAKTINKHIDMVNRDGYLDGSKAHDRQLLWLVVEDESKMEGKLELLLRESGIPFIYFAHGPTRHYGKAQWNIVLKAIEVLRDGFFGNGPVYNLDDDARILPELLDKMWKVGSTSRGSLTYRANGVYRYKKL